MVDKMVALQTIKKGLLISQLLVLAGGSSFPLLALAQGSEDDCTKSNFGFFEVLKTLPEFGDKNIQCFIKDSENTALIRTVSYIANYLVAAIVAVGLMVIVYGGYLYMTAGGNSSQLDEAKKYIAAALVGIAIALMAWLILSAISPQFLPTQDPDAPQPVQQN